MDKKKPSKVSSGIRGISKLRKALRKLRSKAKRWDQDEMRNPSKIKAEIDKLQTLLNRRLGR